MIRRIRGKKSELGENKCKCKESKEERKRERRG